MLQHDGYLDEQMPESVGGVMERVKHRFAGASGDGAWLRVRTAQHRSESSSEQQDTEWKLRCIALANYQYYKKKSVSNQTNTNN